MHNEEKYEISGCKECFNLKFLKYVVTYNKRRKYINENNLKIYQIVKY